MGVHLSEDNGDTTSEIVFGSYNDKMVRFEDIIWNTTFLTNIWSLQFNNLKIGSVALDGVFTGVISGRPYIGLPQKSPSYFALESALINLKTCLVNLDPYGAIMCESEELFTKLPNITFTTMAGVNISIPPKNYIYNVKGNTYKIAIIPVDSDEIILGTPFLSTVYTVLDYHNQNIGLVRNEDMQQVKNKTAFIITFSIIGGITVLIIIVLIIYCIKHRAAKKNTTDSNGAEQSFEVDTKDVKEPESTK